MTKAKHEFTPRMPQKFMTSAETFFPFFSPNQFSEKGGMARRSTWVLLAILCLVCSLSSPGAKGQAAYSSIIGTVTDPQGAALVGAKVAVTSATKGTTVETTTNESGNYAVTHLIPDTYEVKIEAPGSKIMAVPSVRQVLEFTYN